MLLTPKILLSAAVRERCIANFKDLPSLAISDVKPKEKASVLIPLCVQDGEVCILYTKRSSQLKNHSGQVSFPGGKEDDNETVIETALRETEEEIGVSRKNIDIWGTMSEVQGRDKNLLITPVVGVITDLDMNSLKISEQEVEEVFTVPMKCFCDPNNQAYFKYQKLLMPVYLHGKHKIWGITGLITHIFLQCILPSNIYSFEFKGKRYELDELMASKL